LAALLACLPAVAWGMPTGRSSLVVQDTVRRDTTSRRTRADTTRQPGDTIRRPRAPGDTTKAPADTAGNLSASLPPGFEKLDLRLNSRLEAKGEQVKNDRCGSVQLFATGFRCQGTFQPTFDFQFNLLTKGTVADRVHVDVDYDTQREFDASNNISIRYEGKPSEVLQRLEVGNVSFAPPTSRFITSGIPSGNYGVQAGGQVGPMRFSAIAAQQKGNVVQDVEFVVGDRTVQQQTRDIEDYQIEPRRFFFTVDPLRFGAAYPNVDILDRRQLSALAAALPDSIRPSKVFVYRLLLGGQPRNPNGPQFRIIGDPTSQRGQVYELLRERIDYYIDPSLLWFALVTPLSQNSERLVVAYNVRINGRDTTIATTGGTPDLQFVASRDQFANLIWDPRLTPEDSAFRREIRSVYRIGGSDVRRGTVQLRILTGGSADQEKPAGGGADTYIQQLRIAEVTNSARFDADNRLWPRPNDPNRLVAEGGGIDDIFRDYFLIFPSIQPFARAGLVGPIENPANDSIYRTPGEYLYSTRHPQSFYRMRVTYESQVGDEVGTLALNAVQLRPGSERITIDGRQLVRGVDYEIDYELGRVRFMQPDALFPFARRVRVRYEENPLFTTIPTSIFGLTTQFAGEHGALNFTAISQSQRTTFTRPPLGFEPASALVAGVNGAFAFDAAPLGRLIGRSLPFRDSLAGPTTIELQGEFAVSRPRPNSKGQAYIEAFDGEGGISVSLLDNSWYYGSQPTLGTRLASRVGPRALDLARATTLAWQTNGTDRNGNTVQFTIEQIDPQTTLVGTGFSAPETLLWLTLYPLGIGGQRDATTGAYRWIVANPLPGVRWRSIRTSLGASGADLTGVETLEFWTLIDTSSVRRATNPVLVLDLGDVSENSVAFAPETLRVANGGSGTGASGADSTYSGKKLQGYNRLDSERDQFSRAFNVDVNDTGLPGDVVDTLVVVSGGVARADTGVRICTRGDIRRRALGDARSNCTVANSRLDEEDLDADNALRTDERLLRYVVDLTSPKSYDRLGQCNARVDDPNGSRPPTSTLCWAHVRLPLTAPDDTINGGPLLRRVQALRITAISAPGASDAAFITTAVARLTLVGAPWLKRSNRPLTGIAGDRAQLSAGGGYVVAGLIGTESRDSTRGLIYEPPPGITDEPDNLQTPFDPTRVQINERSLRLQAGGLDRYDRAEAFLRFSEGQKSFLGYKQLRVWARGRGNGWGQNGELQFYIKIGRDPNNFYLYRTPVSSGASRAAWAPEIRVAFQKFFALRAKLEAAYLRGASDSISCAGADSALIARSGLPVGAAINRFAACDGGYMVYTTDPAVAPPNLGSVQELAVGMVRVDSATGPTPVIPTDTLEVWVDDIRLADVVSETGFAGQIGLSMALGDLATLRLSATRRDPNFRQLAEAPSFATDNDLELSATVRLDQFLPPRLGVALPLTIAHTTATVDPQFLARSDVSGDEIEGLRTPRTSATTYALAVRRLQPLSGPWYAPIVNHLGVTGTYVTLGDRSEFQDGSRHRFNLSGDYFVTLPVVGTPEGQPRGLRSIMPAWLSTAGQAPGAFNLRPTSLRITSGLARDSERRASFLKPAAAPDDSGRVATGESDLWRNTSSLELQPLTNLTARADVVILRDLRDYDAATPNGAAAGAARGSFLGLDAGIERERQLASSLTYAPEIAGWLRPRVDLASSFSLIRDPNAPLVLPSALAPAPGTETGRPQLAVRLGNTRTITAGAGIDVAKAGTKYAGPASLTARVAQYLQPIDVSITRGILSAYDAATGAPGIGYQLGIGTITGFRELGGGLANSAGASSQLVVSSGLNLPLSVALTNRLQRTTTRNWARRLESDQTTIDGDQIVFPDLNVRWSPRGPLFGGLVKSAGVNGRLLHTRQSLMVPAVFSGAEAEERATRIRTYPVNASLTWGPGEVTTTAGYSYRTQVDSLPGSVTNGNSAEASGEVGRTFKAPPDWGLKSGIRARLGFQQSHTKSYVENPFAAANRSRLTDNGRRAFTLNADTDVADNATFSLQGSRIVNFDRNLNRRLTQTVITAVLQMQFFAGDLR
jgi:hypothetical protein